MNDGGGADRHFSGALVRLVVGHVRARAADEAVGTLLALAGETRSVEEICDETVWTSFGRFEALVQAAGQILGDPDALAGLYLTMSATRTGPPGAAAALRASGSPLAMMRMMEGRNPGCSVVEFTVEDAGPSTIVLRNSFAPGFSPSRELCAFFRGMVGLSPELFGLRGIAVREDGCVRRGDAACGARVSWAEDEGDEGTASSVALLERQLQALRATVAELVSDDPLDVVLQRVVDAAGRASWWARGCVLVLDPGAWSGAEVFVHGVTGEEGSRVAAAAAGATEAGPGMAVLEVVSAKRRYGRLVLAGATHLSVYERTVLEPFVDLAATALDSAVALHEARRQAAAAQAMTEVSAALAEITTTGEMADRVAKAARRALDCDAAIVVLVEDGWGTLAATDGLGQELDTYVRRVTVPVQQGGDFSLRTGEQSSPEARRVLDRLGLVHAVAVPVGLDGSVVALVTVGVRSGPARLHNPEVEPRLRALAGQVAVALRNARLLDQVRHEALHDGLTRLPNRMSIVETAQQMLAGNSSTSVAALFIDLDGFKDVNDRMGHATGDVLLSAVAGRLSQVLRGSDVVGRWGGDEFVVLAHVQNPEQAHRLASRIISQLRQPFLIHEGQQLEISASAGVAVGPRPTVDELLHDADVALYRAKTAGRNCYAVYGLDGA